MDADYTGEVIVNSRRIDAPRERILDAIRTPEILARWWGPRGFTNTFHECDPRPGGRWLFTMHGPDGVDYVNESEFVEVGPERVVIHHLRTVHRFLLTITLDEQAGQTELTWRQAFERPLATRELAQFITQANEQNLDRLEACLGTDRSE